LKQLERGLAVAALIIYGEYVKPPLARRGHLAEEVAGDPR
jgi:hypothetical protein